MQVQTLPNCQMILSWFSGLKYLPLLSKRCVCEPPSGSWSCINFVSAKGKKNTPFFHLFSPKIPCRQGVYMVWFLLFPCVFGFGMGRCSWSSRSRSWFHGFLECPQQKWSGKWSNILTCAYFLDRVTQPPTPVYFLESKDHCFRFDVSEKDHVFFTKNTLVGWIV